MEQVQVQAARRIVELHDVMLTSVLGPQRRANVMREQSELWDSHFSGSSYEGILGVLRPSMPSPVGPDGYGSASAT